MSDFNVIERIIKILQSSESLEQANSQFVEQKIGLDIDPSFRDSLYKLCKHQYQEGSLFSELNLMEPDQKVSQHGFNEKTYAQILAITKIACYLEENQHAEYHAYKLTTMLGDVKSAVEYLKSYAKQFPNSTQSVHDACLFSIPDTDNWDVKTWQAISQTYLQDAGFRKANVLGNAIQIQEKLIEEGWVLTYEKEVQQKIDELKEKIELALEKVRDLEGNIIQLRKEKINSNSPEIIESKIEELLKQKKQYLLDKSSFQNQQNKLKPKDVHLLKDIDQPSLIRTQLSLFYKNANQDMSAAKLFHHYGLQEKDFDQYLELKLKAKDSDPWIPPIEIEGKDYDCPGWYIVKLNKDDPKCAVLGEITACCQSIGNVGDSCVRYGIESDRSGFYVLCKGNNPMGNDTKKIAPKDIIAQCWVWRGVDDTFVIDSVESQPNIREVPGHHEKMNKMFYALASSLVEKYNISRVNVGAGGATPSDLGYLKVPNPVTMVDYHKYRDSYKQREIASKHNLLYCQALCAPDERLIQFVRNLTSEEVGKYDIHKILEIVIQRENVKSIDWCVEQGANVNYTDPSGHSLLFNAIKQNKINAAIALINNGADIDIKIGFPAQSLLEYALNQKLETLADKLIEKGADIQFKDSSGNSVLMLAAKNGLTNIAEKLLAKGANVIEQNPLGKTPLMFAAEQGSTDMINLLINNGADILVKDKSNCDVFMHAVKNGNIEATKEFMKKEGINFNEQNLEGMTPLMMAMNGGYVDLARMLMDLGADIQIKDFNNKTTLMIAAELDQVDIVNQLILLGADVKAKDNHNQSALYYAVNSFGEKETVQALINHGADVNEKNEYGTTLLIRSIESSKSEVAKILIDAGANIHEINEDDETALDYAIGQDLRDVVIKLIKNGIDINTVNYSKDTPLTQALKSGHDELAIQLIELGANVNVSVREDNPLRLAVQYCSNEVVLSLIEHGADINAIDQMGQSPLICAGIFLETEKALLLIDKGADLNIKDHDGKTLFDWQIDPVVREAAMKALEKAKQAAAQSLKYDVEQSQKQQKQKQAAKELITKLEEKDLDRKDKLKGG